jgi:phosphatidylserine/phosphatidylglycerophosphate/cardiolipin synthase-like enzyme
MRDSLLRSLKRLLLVLLAATCMWPFLLHRPRLLPVGAHVRKASRLMDRETPQLLVDSTAYDCDAGTRVIRQEIFDTMLRHIEEAQRIVFLDFFLWNSWKGSTHEAHRPLAGELTEALLRKRAANPEIAMLVLTDPINRVYGTSEEAFYARLAASGIPIVFTDLNRLRDSNPLYSIPARHYGRLLKRLGPIRRWLETSRKTHPFDPEGPDVSVRQWARLFHFKANHRKVLITDHPEGGLRLLVTSLNPADGSSAHSNMGIVAQGAVAYDALEAELDTVEWSAAAPGHVLCEPEHAWTECVARLRTSRPPPQTEEHPELSAGQPLVEWNSEGAIRNRALAMLNTAGPGDQVRMAMFYLADRDIVKSLLNAARSGAEVRLILDPNRDAFGYVKNGIPNRPVAGELMTAASRHGYDLQIRWADTHGEQFHIKALSVHNPVTGRHEVLCGSANFTRRNLDNFNLESALYVADSPDIVGAYGELFETAWHNKGNLRYTAPYPDFALSGFELVWKTWLYRLQECTGLCTF